MAEPEFEFFPPVGFEWDEEKSQTNLIKRGITPAKFFTGRLSSEPQQRGAMDRDRKIS
jgi:uncharacterized DUF497 family protein